MTPFVLVASGRDTLIVNRLDWGVGLELLASGYFQREEADLIARLLDKRREYYGDGVVVFDCGANIGTHAITWAKHMRGWGWVTAIEAQERIFYALAGNIALSNCFNARAVWAAVGREAGTMQIPTLDYGLPSHFSGFELKKRSPDNIGQNVDYENRLNPVAIIAVDDFAAPRVDLIKIDVEGMDFEVLQGAEKSILAHKPIIYIEVFKNDKDGIRDWLEQRGYIIAEHGINFLATHKDDISYDV